MTDGEIVLPAENAKIDWKRYYLRIGFHPAIKLSRNDGLRFALGVGEYLDLEHVRPSAGELSLAGGSVCEGVHVDISRQFISLDAHDPQNHLEWYENRFRPVLNEFAKVFQPQIALHCNVTVVGMIDMPGGIDARSFLGGYVMLMHPHKLTPIKRPLQVLGVRLLFPAFDESEDVDGEKADWSVDVRVESSIADTKKLWIEADADWNSSEEWGSGFTDKAVGRMKVIEDFVSDRLVKFLRQPPLPDETDEDYETGEEDDAE